MGIALCAQNDDKVAKEKMRPPQHVITREMLEKDRQKKEEFLLNNSWKHLLAKIKGAQDGERENYVVVSAMSAEIAVSDGMGKIDILYENVDFFSLFTYFFSPPISLSRRLIQLSWDVRREIFSLCLSKAPASLIMYSSSPLRHNTELRPIKRKQTS